METGENGERSPAGMVLLNLTSKEELNRDGAV